MGLLFLEAQVSTILGRRKEGKYKRSKEEKIVETDN
jgi:hypothetical protein